MTRVTFIGDARLVPAAGSCASTRRGTARRRCSSWWSATRARSGSSTPSPLSAAWPSCSAAACVWGCARPASCSFPKVVCASGPGFCSPWPGSTRPPSPPPPHGLPRVALSAAADLASDGADRAPWCRRRRDRDAGHRRRQAGRHRRQRGTRRASRVRLRGRRGLTLAGAYEAGLMLACTTALLAVLLGCELPALAWTSLVVPVLTARRRERRGGLVAGAVGPLCGILGIAAAAQAVALHGLEGVILGGALFLWAGAPVRPFAPEPAT